MQFSYPVMLYALVLLLIPILIHLFQLQRFEKVVFTNLKLLKKLELQSRKSAKLKQFLILISRLLALACLILAFAQPFIKNTNTLESKNIAIYLDNSLSMQSHHANGTLLEHAKSILLERFPANINTISFRTNQAYFGQLNRSQFLEKINRLDYSIQSNIWKDIPLLEVTSLPQQVIIISDFQNNQLDEIPNNWPKQHQYHLVNLKPNSPKNISVKQLDISPYEGDQLKFEIELLNQNSDQEEVAVALFLNQQLAGKTMVNLKNNNVPKAIFNLPYQDQFTGYIEIDDASLTFDNQYYFAKNAEPKTQILIVGSQADFLKKIYPKEQFNLTHLPQLSDYTIFNQQDLVILNELDQLNKGLIQALKQYVFSGGRLVVVPSINTELQQYQNFFNTFNLGTIQRTEQKEQLISQIEFNHPFFNGVFQKSISNFSYPKSNHHFKTNMPKSSQLLGFSDDSDFINQTKIGDGYLYWIASALNDKNSNFTRSPLVVPTFYNFSIKEHQTHQYAYQLAKAETIQIENKEQKAGVLHLLGHEIDLIPLQENRAKTTLLFTQNIDTQSGLYHISQNSDTLKQVAFNYLETEGKLQYTDIKMLRNNNDSLLYYNDLQSALSEIESQNKRQELWQLFLIFALIFLGIEALLQKFLKN